MQKSNLENNKELSKQLKAHHFSIAEYSKEAPTADYTSVTK